MNERDMSERTWQLLGPDGRSYASPQPGTFGGHRKLRVYGRLDCPSALRAIARGHYVTQRVFVPDESSAIAAGYRPCGKCLPARYAEWKADPRGFGQPINVAEVGRAMDEPRAKPDRKSWTIDENCAIVEAYFAMLDDELAERDYSKTAMRRRLMAGTLSGRSKGSIEFKLQNVSAVLDDYGLPWIEGYKPRRNYQQDLASAVYDAARVKGFDPQRHDL